MIDLSKYRVIDLSYDMIPHEYKMNGQYVAGETLFERPMEVHEYTIGNGTLFQHIRGHLHCGTHVECAYKYSPDGEEFGEIGLETYMGIAAACNFTHKKPGDEITIADFQAAGVQAGDIVLAWADEHDGGGIPHITNEAIDWLRDLKIKMLGLENVRYSPPGTPIGLGDSDYRMLMAGIPMVDCLLGLDQITRPRVFFMALPIKLHRAGASWTRAIALEEMDT